MPVDETLREDRMSSLMDNLALTKAILSNPEMIRVKPAVSLFMLQYLRKFSVRNVGGNLVIHSHLPPVNSKAYSRFIDEHLLGGINGPSHAQVGVTNACPQGCAYCYNRHKAGAPMDRETILRTVADLKRIGVFWLGLTGGEPLLNKHLVEIVESAAAGCAVKLFTTGCTLMPQRAADLRQAGLTYVSVSLDSPDEAEHDRIRRYPGAYRTALQAIDIFQNLGGVHVSVSAVLGKGMLREERVEELLGFLADLGIDEAWLSECKPAVQGLWSPDEVISEEERQMLLRVQDRHNRDGGMTVNYLGHFEGRETFGCNAGNKMVYVDAFGNVSPCVFTPISFGNVADRPIDEIYAEMRGCFPTENRCFINTNYALVRKYYRGTSPIPVEETRELMQDVRFGPRARFYELQSR
jgi:MoaA/NifB/PqqE/SkfB family radical SAM enzyme